MNAILKEALETLCDASAALSSYEEELRAVRKSDFVAAGGCPKCGGRGWVVTWDTLDSLSGSYAEYDTCPDCKGAKRAFPADLDRSYHCKYDQNRGVPQLPLAAEAAEKVEWEKLSMAVETASVLVASLRAALDPKVKGKRVRVYKGRKVAVGTEGVVFWMGTRRINLSYGSKTEERLGFKTDDGQTVWVNVENCEGVLTIRA